MTETWRTLQLNEDQLEVLVHMSIKRGAPQAVLVGDVWPDLPLEEGLARLAATVAQINAAASAATGKPGAVIVGPEGSTGAAFGVQAPELYVQVLGERRVQVR